MLVQAEPTRAPAFASLGYPGTLAGSACGLNSAGLAFVGDSLPFRPESGVPKNFALRALLGCRSLADARSVMHRKPRLASHAVLCVSAGERAALAIESGPRITVEEDIGGDYVHANHAHSPRLLDAGHRPSRDSYVRQAALGAAQEKVRSRSLVAAFGALRHASRSRRDHFTLAAVVMDAAAGRMYVQERGRRTVIFAVPAVRAKSV